MSLPNYLAKIKSSGVYRYVFDKSVVPSEYQETLRLLVGYSDKGPFNTPVYIDNTSDFINTFGNISKRLEKRGSYFHRSALQALDGGPILALNLKPFKDETFACDSFTPGEISTKSGGVLQNQIASNKKVLVKDLYDTNRFWKLDADQLPSKLGSIGQHFIYLTSTGTKSKSCTVFMRKYEPESYDVSLYEWYTNNSDQEMPEYMIGHENELLKDYFADVFVFRGEITPELAKGPLKDYFIVSPENNITLKSDLQTATGDQADTLEMLADDPNSNFVARYRGCLIPYFKDSNNRYISLDILFNNDNYTHDMLMKLDEEWLYDSDNNFASIKFVGENGKPIPSLDGTRTVGMFKYLSESQYNAETRVPTITGQSNYIYLVPTADGTDNNQYTEWTYDSSTGTWEVIGGNSLSTSDIDAAISGQSEGEQIEALAENGERGGESTPSGYQLYYAYVQGYDYKMNDETIKQSLKMLTDKGIYEALTNNVDAIYHYLVDTYKSNVETNCKQILFQVAKAKDNCLALVNFPPIQDFMDLSYFRKDGKFDMSLIASNTSNFSVASSSQGASWGAYYTPIIVSDGTVKEVVPSAACVSNNFMIKYESRQPYDIVAGPKYGVISTAGLVGPDYNYSRKDLDVLEPFGVNAIIYVPRKGTYINSNQTAKQVPVSALSKVHVRELVIYLQDEIESLLQSYQWDKNTASLRATIKAKADTILENVMQNDGVYAYKNVCDETNNTSEVIDNEMIILDTDIEPARGAGKLVQRLTIHKTGGISTSTM